jgi:hypothetical protein
MSQPIVVQGVAVPQQGNVVQGVAVPQQGNYENNNNNNNGNGSYTAHNNYNDDQASPEAYEQQIDGGNFNGYKGEPQPKKFNDVFFAILFYAHLFVMVVLGVMYGPYMIQNNGGGGAVSGAGAVVFCVSVCGMFAMGLSSLALGFMMKYPQQLIKMGLFFSIGMSLCVGLLGLLSGQIMMAVMGFLSCAVGVCYAYFAWSKIPFAAANLNTALTAVRCNMGLSAVAYLALLMAFGWSMFWSVAAGGTMMALGQNAMFLFLVSYYWVHQVLQNSVHVTNAGVIGTWWFAPLEASTCCSEALWTSLGRATTYSFGSICMGSLFVAIVQALRAMLRMAQNSEDSIEGCNFLVCILQCILGCIEGLIEELNKWAYVYVGLYGYTYIEASRNVMTLFANKGWSSIVTDDLVENVLSMTSVAIGLLTGLVGLAIVAMDQNVYQNMGFENPALIGFA